MVPKLRRGQLYEAASENPTWGVKSFWPGLRMGRGGVCLQGSKARREPGADLAHEMKADTAAGTEVCLKQIHSQNRFLWQFLSRQTKNQCICGKSWWVTATAFLVGEDLSVNSDFQKVYEDWGKVIVEQFRSKMLEYTFCAVFPCESLCMGQSTITPLHMLKHKEEKGKSFVYQWVSSCPLHFFLLWSNSYCTYCSSSGVGII